MIDESVDTLPNHQKPSRTELQKYIEDEVYSKHYLTYAKNAKRSFYFWKTLLFTSIISGFVSSVIAVFVKADYFPNFGPIAIIIIPLLGSISAAILGQVRFLQQYDIWEGGRLEFNRIIADGRRRLAGAKSEEECNQIHEDLINRVSETDQIYTERLTALFGHRTRKKRSKKKA